MATIQVMSDLHLECPKAYDVFDIVPRAPHLALLGDIGNTVLHREEYLVFLLRHLQKFQTILLVPGNHEAYGSTWRESLAVLRAFEQDVKERRSTEKSAGESRIGLGQLVVLDRGIFELPTDSGNPIVILGCRLFSHIPPQREMAVEMGLQDFFQTASWDTNAHNEAHSRDLAWLNDRVGQLQRGDADVRIAILTHWSPTTDSRSMDPKHMHSQITAGFATELSDQTCFTGSKVILWVFGHTHYNCDFAAERKGARSLRLVTNQRGSYFSQAKGFDLEKVIHL